MNEAEIDHDDPWGQVFLALPPSETPGVATKDQRLPPAPFSPDTKSHPTYIYSDIYIHAYIHIYIYVYIELYIYIHIYVCICIYTYTYVYVYMCINLSPPGPTHHTPHTTHTTPHAPRFHASHPTPHILHPPWLCLLPI